MRLLLVTMCGEVGGVNPMIKAFVATLQRLGHTVTIAASGSRHLLPEISVPAWQIPLRAPGIRTIRHLELPVRVVGSYIPELEWCRVLPHAGWQRLMSQHDGCVGVLGSILPAFPLAASGRPALCWVATGHREERLSHFRDSSYARRCYEIALNLPICEFMERYALRRVDVLSLSPHTAGTLTAIEPRARLVGVLLPPIDLDHFSPGQRPETTRYRIGFAGRVVDPRKNVGLLIEATARLVSRGWAVQTDILGGEPDNRLRGLVTKLGLDDTVAFRALGDRNEVADFYRMLDVFVIPSTQEGLAIVGLEAMACGLPVVSTFCGGPSAYVKNGQTGFQVNFSATEMADKIETLLGNKALRKQIGQQARAFVEANNSRRVFEESVESHLARTFQP